MRSQLDVRLGSQTPTLIHRPPDVHNLDAAAELIELADAYGVCDGYPLSESQRITLENACGERADGRWAATRVGDFGPRQGTGKNDKIAARELAGLLLFGENLIIHTAHEFQTANESFLRLVAVFENWDDLRARVARIRYANGEQGIELLSGQRLKYRARTGGSGRGFAKADLVVYDEAQHLSREHVAASGPTKLANPNSQTWYAGSGGPATSAVAWGIRRDALTGGEGSRLAYTEMTAERVWVDEHGRLRTAPPVDPLDRAVWYACIPGLGRWVTEEGVEALYEELGEALFLREILCVWEPEPGDFADGVVPADAWAALADPDSHIATHRNVALDVSRNHQWATFGSAGRRTDGLVHVESFDRRPGTGWVMERAAELHAKWRVPIRVAAGSPAASFIGKMTEAGVDVYQVPLAEQAQALGAFVSDALNGNLRHLGGSHLDSALRGAVMRPSGDVDVLSRRNSSADITPLVAVTLALGGVPAARRKPRIHVLTPKEVAT